MTKDEAFKRINDAISDNKAAAQISTALDALGLLNLGRLAYQPGFHPPGVEPEDISRADPQPSYASDPSRWPATQLPPEGPAGSHGIGSLPPPPDDLPNGRDQPVTQGRATVGGGPEYWAGKRQRT